jgi:heme exporter protein A
MIASLSAENLACARGGRAVFAGLSFCIAAGGALAVEGANGAGKTSLLRMIAGFLAPASGRLMLKDESGESEESEARGAASGWLGHQDGLKPQLSVSEQLEFFARLYRSRPDMDKVLRDVGLARQQDLACRYLSAGQKRRLALARLVVSARPLWLLDEPFMALDREGQALMTQLMIRHCGRGGMVVAATHEPLGLAMQSIRL